MKRMDGLWPLRLWVLAILGVFLLQIGIIFVGSNRTLERQRPPAPAPWFSLAGPENKALLALMDPTLFARPHPRGFSGSAWVATPDLDERFADPPEATTKSQFLALNLGEIGGALSGFVQTNSVERTATASEPASEIALPALAPVMPLRSKTRVKIEGNLAARRMVGVLSVSSWPSTGLLTNTVVKLTVDGRGRFFSAALVSSSGSRDADQEAMKQAREAKFEEIARGGPGGADPATMLDWGWLVFEWNSLPLPATNGAPSHPGP
jgi:TonB family protein